jgi:transposase-like protein
MGCGLRKTDTLIRVIPRRRRCPTRTEHRKTAPAEVKREAIRLVTEQHDGVAETARDLSLNVTRLRRWTQATIVSTPAAVAGQGRLALEPHALRQRRDAVTRWRRERDSGRMVSDVGCEATGRVRLAAASRLGPRGTPGAGTVSAGEGDGRDDTAP